VKVRVGARVGARVRARARVRVRVRVRVRGLQARVLLLMELFFCCVILICTRNVRQVCRSFTAFTSSGTVPHTILPFPKGCFGRV
jgi:hypothetical protein